MNIADVLRLARELTGLAKRMGGVLPVDASDLPLKALAAGIADRGDQLGLTWRLIPATVSPAGESGEMRVTLDGDSVAIAAVSMIGRLAVGARVFVILSPPAGVHIVGFLGYDFPPSVVGEAIGRSRMLVQTQAVNSSSSTFVDVPGITFTAAANASYEIRIRMSPAALLGDDYKFQWVIPSGAGMDRYVLSPAPAYAGNDASAITSMMMRRSGSGSVVGGGIAAVGGDATHHEDCYLKTLATGGTVQLQWARSSSSGSAATLRTNGYAIVQRYR